MRPFGQDAKSIQSVPILKFRDRDWYLSGIPTMCKLQDVKLINSGFWTNHFYKCNNVKMLDLHIQSPHLEVKAPSTDAIDIDICTNFLIKGCFLSVNDDAIALKGRERRLTQTKTKTMVPIRMSSSRIVVSGSVIGIDQRKRIHPQSKYHHCAIAKLTVQPECCGSK